MKAGTQLSAYGMVLLAWLVQLLGAVMYSRHLTRRLRDEGFEHSARATLSALRSWIISGVGILFLGPIVLLVLYCRMLWRIRNGIGRIPEPARAAP